MKKLAIISLIVGLFISIVEMLIDEFIITVPVIIAIPVMSVAAISLVVGIVLALVAYGGNKKKGNEAA